MEYNLFKKEIKVECDLVECKFNDTNILNRLRQKVINLCNKNLEERNKTNVKAKFSGFESLKQDEDLITILKDIDPIVCREFWNGRKSIANAWGNVYEKGDYAKRHNHRGTTAFSMILYLTDGGPGTYFHQLDICTKEEIGKIILFSPELEHEVIQSDLPHDRITLAANIDRLEEFH